MEEYAFPYWNSKIVQLHRALLHISRWGKIKSSLLKGKSSISSCRQFDFPTEQMLTNSQSATVQQMSTLWFPFWPTEYMANVSQLFHTMEFTVSHYEMFHTVKFTVHPYRCISCHLFLATRFYCFYLQQVISTLVLSPVPMYQYLYQYLYLYQNPHQYRYKY